MKPFEEIYQETYRKLLRLAVKMTGNGDGASDVVQEIFIDYFNRTSRGITIHHPETWLYRSVLNKSIDHNRKAQRFRPLNAAGEMHADPGHPEAWEQKMAIRQALSALKPAERTLVTLYSEGLSYKEISEVAGIKFASVGKTLARILKKMEKELNRHHYEMP